MVKVTLDAETFKALASPTRLGVLRSLDERRKTVTELARDLEMNKATIHEHLQLLAAAGLVRKRDDEGRKWIYYELTWRGQRIIHPQETTTFNLLLGLGVAAAGGGVAVLGRALGWWWAENQMGALGDAGEDGTRTLGPEGSGGGAPEEGSPSAGQAADDADAPPPSEMRAAEPDEGPTFWDEDGWLALALLALAILCSVLAAWTRRRLVGAPTRKS